MTSPYSTAGLILALIAVAAIIVGVALLATRTKSGFTSYVLMRPATPDAPALLAAYSPRCLAGGPFQFAPSSLDSGDLQWAGHAM